MLKKYTKYAATALAVASLSTFMIGCGETTDDTPPIDMNKKYEKPGGKVPGPTDGESPGPPDRTGKGPAPDDLPPTK
jgi:hypothetical protein